MTPIKLDDRDIKILAILSREGRISKSDLAKRVNLSATPCWERLSRLEKAGIISGYRADIELKNIAPQVSVFVMAELENHRAATFQAFEQAVDTYDEIVSCWALGGGFDYLLHVITRDIDSYNDQLAKWDRESFIHPSTHLAQHARGETATRIIKSAEGSSSPTGTATASSTPSPGSTA
jgi:Lrp/AsnC family transcriptional regulator of ectoine degradation